MSKIAHKTRNSQKSSHKKGTNKKWVREVKTVSTFPPKDVFTKDAQTIADSLGSKSVSPKGIGSGIRMIQYFINRAGKNLPAARKKVLEHAKHLLQERREKEKSSEKRRTAKR
jgi:tRNA(adenine34) deaminase